MNTNDILKKGSIHVLDKNNELKVFAVTDAQGDCLENRDSAGHEAHDGEGMGHEAGDPGHFSTFEQEKEIYSAQEKNHTMSLKSMIEIRKKSL